MDIKSSIIYDFYLLFQITESVGNISSKIRSLKLNLVSDLLIRTHFHFLLIEYDFFDAKVNTDNQTRCHVVVLEITTDLITFILDSSAARIPNHSLNHELLDIFNT